MKCNCKRDIEEKIKVNGYQGKKIIRAELDALIVFSNPMKLFTSTNITLTIEGRKSKIDLPVAHSYCPFCGIKAEDEVEEKATNNLNQATG